MFLISHAFGKLHCLCLFRNPGSFHYLTLPSFMFFVTSSCLNLCCCQIQDLESKKVEEAIEKTFPLSQWSGLKVAHIIFSHVLLMRTLPHGHTNFQRRLWNVILLSTHIPGYYSINAKRWQNRFWWTNESYGRLLVLSLILCFLLDKYIILGPKKQLHLGGKLEYRFPFIVCIGQDDYDHNIFPIAMNKLFFFSFIKM